MSESMKIIGKDEFDNAPTLIQSKIITLIDENIAQIIPKLDNPIELQKEVTAQVYLSLQKRMKDEMSKNGFLSDSTRQWITQFNSMCDSLQKNLYGEKSVSLHVHKISHSQIAAHIRKASENIIDIEDIKDDAN